MSMTDKLMLLCLCTALVVTASAVVITGSWLSAAALGAL
jgi:hypothetical protein